ncbi:MAG: glycine cleavage system protein GcvH [Bacteroidetes bacterium]|nr:glycine cleavage system protein GcvH [Bacteroidota bacterium]MBU2585163.1 glycine cleavage system protein GcvH [Bacteroidota bacterium]
MDIPDNLKYTNDHEWIKVEGNTGTIGITDYAQGELGDIVFVDIQNGLEEIQKGNSFGTIEAVKTVSDLLAPISGKVLEINKELESNAEIVNKDPYGAGWIIKIEINDLVELDSLLDAVAYGSLIGA